MRPLQHRQKTHLWVSLGSSSLGAAGVRGDMQVPGTMREGPQSSLVFSYSLLASDGQFTHQAGTMTLAPLPKEDLKAPTKMVMSLTLSRLLVIARPRSTLHYVLSPPSPPATLCLEVNQGPQAQWAISDHVEPWGLHSMHPTCRGQRPPLL